MFVQGGDQSRRNLSLANHSTVYFVYFLCSYKGPVEQDSFNHELRGVIPRGFEYLFNLINREKEKVGLDNPKTSHYHWENICNLTGKSLFNQIFPLTSLLSSGINLNHTWSCEAFLVIVILCVFQLGDKVEFLCQCSFLEIYNEQIFDLLDPTLTGLQLREDIKRGVFVDGMLEKPVSSARDVYDVSKMDKWHHSLKEHSKIKSSNSLKILLQL